MDSFALWATVIVAGVLSALAIAYVLRPILAPGPAQMVLENDELSDLVGRKDAALRAIKDLEFDYRVGKIEDEEYQRLDQRLRRQAIALIQQIDKLAPASSTLDDQLESAIARMRKTQPSTPESAKAPAASAPVPVARPANGSQPARFCTTCGHLLEPSHKFCANCGTPVAAPALVAGDGASV